MQPAFGHSALTREPSQIGPTPKRVLILNQYYPPDVASTGQTAAVIAAALSERGAVVTVVTGQPSYTADVIDAARTEAHGSLTIHRVPMGRTRGRTSLVTRAKGYLRFLILAWRESRRLDRPDIVVAFHNPPLVGALGLLLANAWGASFVNVIQDIHPDILVRTGWPLLPKVVIALWRTLNRVVLGRATHVITLSEQMSTYLVRHYGVAKDHVSAIPLWGEPELTDTRSDVTSKTQARARLKLDLRSDDLLVLYAGNMGVMHPVDTIVKAAFALRDRGVVFLFVGGGKRRSEVEILAGELSLSNVIFLPYQAEDAFVSLIVAADVCVVALSAGLEDLCLPSRSMTFMSAGRPVLAVMTEDAPLSRALDDFGAGWSATTPEGVARVLTEVLGAPERLVTGGLAARALYRSRYRREYLVQRYVEAILEP